MHARAAAAGRRAGQGAATYDTQDDRGHSDNVSQKGVLAGQGGLAPKGSATGRKCRTTDEFRTPEPPNASNRRTAAAPYRVSLLEK